MTKIFQFLVVAAFFVLVRSAPPHESCNIYDGRRGRCREISQCDWAEKRLHSNFLFRRIPCRSFRYPDFDYDTICCPYRKKPESQEYCDDINDYSLSLGSSIERRESRAAIAKMQELRHTVALGYRSIGQTQVSWNCGGSMITKKFVLTAAHCLSEDLKVVSMGSNDLTATIGHEFQIKRQIKHPEFVANGFYHDIALLELDKSQSLIKDPAHPICLPKPSSKSATNDYSIAGWGLIKDHVTTNQLQKSYISEISNSECGLEILPSENLTMGIKDFQICAKKATTNSEEYLGDEGSSLFFKHNEINYIYAVRSLGSPVNESARVFTRIAPYLKWIENEVWPLNGSSSHGYYDYY